MAIFSLQVEKHVVGGLINHPKAFFEISDFISDKDFYNEVHAVIFSIIKLSILNNENIDKVMISQKINNLGVSFKDGINIFDYIDSISYTEITEKALIEAARELVKIRIRREIYETGEELQKYVKNNGEEGMDSIISSCDHIYAKTVSAISLNEEPENLFEGIEKFIEEKGNNPLDEVGFITPHDEFNRLYGGIKNKNLYAIVSRSGQGKTTWLVDMIFKICKMQNFETLGVFLDTEMESEDLKLRLISSLSGVGMWYLETGNWRKNAEMTESVRKILPEANKYKLFHLKVGNKTIDQVCSILRRFRFKHGRDKKMIAGFDYIKVSELDKISESFKEHQSVGQKVDKLKKLSEELDIPILTAMQMNRSGENQNRKSSDIADDSSAISLSDRLQWYASFVAILRRKTLDEIALDGVENGTHKLITTKTRFQGKDAAGHQDLVKRKMPDGSEKYVSNYLSFSIDNFNVEEKGSLNTILESSSLKYDITDNENPQDSSL